MRLHATRGFYDLTSVEGAAGPIQVFGLLAAAAAVQAAGTTFQHKAFTAWAFSMLLIAHGVSLALRLGEPSTRARLTGGGILLVVAAAATAILPGVRDGALTPDMASDTDVFIGGLMVWIALAAQCFASVPGVLLFALVPELAAFAVFGQMNLGPEMPALYSLYLASALGLLSYASFLRRRRGVAPVRRVLPAPREMGFGIAVLFLFLAVGGGCLTIILRSAVPQFYNAEWLRRGYVGLSEAVPQRYDSFGDALNLRSSGGATNPSIVLRVEAPRPVLLRRKVYSRYTGDAWVPRGRTGLRGELDNDGNVPRRLIQGVPMPSEELICRVEAVQDLEGPLPVAGMPEQIGGLGTLGAQVTYYGTVEFYSFLAPGQSFTFRSRERLGADGGLEGAGADCPYSLVADGYLDILPEALELRRLALDLTDDEPTVAGKVAALQRYLEKECVYNLAAPPPARGVDSAVDFVKRRKQGACTDFASALAILCRLVGIPSRVVSGYAAADPDPADGTRFVVREKDAHAWVEVYLAEVGWVTYDPHPERVVDVTRYEQLQASMREAWSATRLWFHRNPLIAIALAPLAYVALYEMRRRGARWRPTPREMAGQTLRRVLGVLEPWAPWTLPGRAPWETANEALRRMPEEHHAGVVACMSELLRLRYGPDEPSEALLTPALARAKELRRRLRRLSRRRSRRSVAG